MNSMRKQSGFTVVGLIIVFAIIGVVVLSVIKVFPMYMEHLSVSKSMETLQNDPQLPRMSPGEIKNLLTKKLDVNQVTSVKPEHIKITKIVGVVRVIVEYEVRKNYFGNLDIVAHFKDEFEVTPS